MFRGLYLSGSRLDHASKCIGSYPMQSPYAIAPCGIQYYVSMYRLHLAATMRRQTTWLVYVIVNYLDLRLLNTLRSLVVSTDF